LPNGKNTEFWLISFGKNAKIGSRSIGEQLFLKKMKKLLAHKKISCTFAAAFGNE